MSSRAQASAARNAADATRQASDQATQLQQETYLDQRALMAPSITAGASARARQMLMQGFSPAEVRAYLQSTNQAVNSTPVAGGAPGPMGPRIAGATRFGEPTEFFTPEAPEAPQTVAGENYDWVDNWNYQSQSPSYDFRLREGQKALERSKVASGDFFSGDTARALNEFGQNFASTEFENDFRRLGSIAGDGSQSAGVVVNAAGNFGANAAQNTMAAGNARASGYQQAGAANANFWGNTIPGAFGYAYGQGWFGKK